MATELERTLADALRAYRNLDWTLGEQQTGLKPLVIPLREATKQADEALALYDTAQSQPGDMGEARSGESGAVAWYIDCVNPETGTEYRSVTFDRTSVTSLHKPLYTHPSDSALLAAVVEMQGVLPVLETDSHAVCYQIMKRARELDAARDRGAQVGPCIRCGAVCKDDAEFDVHVCKPGEARTAEGVGGGATVVAFRLWRNGKPLNPDKWENGAPDDNLMNDCKNSPYSIELAYSTPLAGMVTVPASRLQYIADYLVMTPKEDCAARFDSYFAKVKWCSDELLKLASA